MRDSSKSIAHCDMAEENERAGDNIGALYDFNTALSYAPCMNSLDMVRNRMIQLVELSFEPTLNDPDETEFRDLCYTLNFPAPPQVFEDFPLYIPERSIFNSKLSHFLSGKIVLPNFYMHKAACALFYPLSTHSAVLRKEHASTLIGASARAFALTDNGDTQYEIILFLRSFEYNAKLKESFVEIKRSVKGDFGRFLLEWLQDAWGVDDET